MHQQGCHLASHACSGFASLARISACCNVTMCCCWCGTTLCLWQGVYPGFQPKAYPAVPGLEGEHEPAAPPLDVLVRCCFPALR